MISTDKLVAGQAIPALRPLAARFGVAVPTMRESLRRLEGMGILEFRHGSGIYVGPNSTRMVLANVLAPRPTGEQLAQLLQARLVIEPPIAALAATVRSADGVDQLERALEDAHGCLLSGDPRLVAANVDIHRSVAAATGNAVLAETLDSLAAVHAADQAEILELYGDAAQDYDEHAEIVRHIRSGDAEGGAPGDARSPRRGAGSRQRPAIPPLNGPALSTAPALNEERTWLHPPVSPHVGPPSARPWRC